MCCSCYCCCHTQPGVSCAVFYDWHREHRKQDQNANKQDKTPSTDKCESHQAHGWPAPPRTNQRRQASTVSRQINAAPRHDQVEVGPHA